MLLTPGSRIGPYQVVAALGKGGVGEVYLADDPRLRRRVAIKILNAKFAGDELARARFVREAQMAAALDHPNICTLHEINADQGFDYLVMQALEGETLAARLERGRPSFDEALDIAVQLAGALAYAHERGVIHRDIKPQNVMLTPRVKLMDFGLAKAPGRLDDQQDTQTSLTREGLFFGTIAYMAPELLAGAPADRRTDVFSLGVTLYELFAGRHPFASATAAATITAIASRPAAALSAVAPETPRALTPILAKALAAAPEDRHQTASELLADLEAVRRGAAPAARAGGGGTRRALMGAAALGAIALAIWVVATQVGSRRNPAGIEEPPAAAAVPAPAFTVWLEIQPAGAGRDTAWLESIGGDTLRVDSRFRVQVVPNRRGSLYIVSDEWPVSGGTPALTLLYPMADMTSAVAGAVTTPAYVVGGPAADSDVWIVWAASDLRELEAVKPLVNAKTLGVIQDAAAAGAVRGLLADAAARSTSSIDSAANRVVVRSASDTAAHRFSLKQR